MLWQTLRGDEIDPSTAEMYQQSLLVRVMFPKMLEPAVTLLRVETNERPELGTYQEAIAQHKQPPAADLSPN